MDQRRPEITETITTLYTDLTEVGVQLELTVTARADVVELEYTRHWNDRDLPDSDGFPLSLSTANRLIAALQQAVVDAEIMQEFLDEAVPDFDDEDAIPHDDLEGSCGC